MNSFGIHIYFFCFSFSFSFSVEFQFSFDFWLRGSLAKCWQQNRIIRTIYNIYTPLGGVAKQKDIHMQIKKAKFDGS